MTVQQRNSQMVELLRADFQARYEPQFALAQYMASVLALPGLRGFWPMSAYNASGNAFDQSGNGRLLTYNGNPTYNWDGLAPYIDLDGTGDFLSRADEAGLSITGTETYVANPGLTLGGWWYFESLGTVDRMMAKDVNPNHSYILRVHNNTGQSAVNFQISVNGTGFTSSISASDDTISTGNWFFIAGRFTPSTEVAVWVNGTKFTNTSSIDASIFDGSSAFRIGANSSGNNPMTGRASLCFLCAAALSDAMVGNLFSQSRAIFGV